MYRIHSLISSILKLVLFLYLLVLFYIIVNLHNVYFTLLLASTKLEFFREE